MMSEITDRTENVVFGGVRYRLTLKWNRRSARKLAQGMPPSKAEITRDGKPFATILCSSSFDGFMVVNHHAKGERAEWRVLFTHDDINDIPLPRILRELQSKGKI